MSEEPENSALALLRKIDAKVDDLRDELRAEIAEAKSELRSLRADIASDLVALEKNLGDQIVGLRRKVMDYRSLAVGHGVLLTGFEERLRRLERHVGLPPEAAEARGAQSSGQGVQSQ